jgi:cytochrome oxidase assembly protein ShyY1
VYGFLRSPRWLGWLAGAVALATVLTLLGFWQLSRYEQRSEINARIDAAERVEPEPLAALVPAPGRGQEVGPPAPPEAGWMVVTATGRFDPGHAVLVRNRTVQGRVGFEVLTPLVLPDGAAVLVDRGWVPPAPGGAAQPPEVPSPPAGQVTVIGRVRPSEGGDPSVGHHQGVLQTRRVDVEALAPHLPYPLYHAYLLEESPSDPGLTTIPVRRENAWLNGGYAVQWWIFAAMVLVGFGWLARREAGRGTMGLSQRARNGEVPDERTDGDQVAGADRLRRGP